MYSDIEIAGNAQMLPIYEVAEKLGIREEDVEPYGKYKAKINDEAYVKNPPKKGKLVLVTAVNPTPAGEGKTTVTIGLGQALNKMGHNAVIAIREPSLGPCMGVKGGAAGGGYSQVVPMEDINLHFTGDIHAMTAANNLLASMIDNHIFQGNALKIDSRTITWKRAVDMNDRALRNIVVGLGGKINGYPREDGFIITVASEVMAVLCLSENLEDLKEKLGQMMIGYNLEGNPVFCKDIGAQGAMATLLKDAIKPNLVQTLENTPVLVHGGPFANIAHGNNSVRATKLALSLGDIVVTEAGFGADLGAQKFFDIKCRKAKLSPEAVVVVATVRALKYNGGAGDLAQEDLQALKKGIVNLEKHIENMKKYGVPVVVAINRFTQDTEQELDLIKQRCTALGVRCALSEVWEKGGEGGIELGEAVLQALTEPSEFKLLYEDHLGLKEKIETIAREIYGADGVNYSIKAERELENAQKLGFGHFPICIAKTQYSFSDKPHLLGRPEGFTIDVNEVKISAGAGFIVVIAGNIMTMPGLPKKPAALAIDVNNEGKISGLF